ncbi:MAG: hypothetical protein JNK48_04710 [Bryobacterales bacterium]|nr:hypothetical protein [Bryobacterales bacterium]
MTLPHRGAAKINSMRYDHPAPVTHHEFDAILRGGDTSHIARALIGAALSGDGRQWIEPQALALLRHNDHTVARAAILTLGHLARIHRTLDPGTLPALEAMRGIPELAGAIDDAIDDIGQFLPADPA